MLLRTVAVCLFMLGKYGNNGELWGPSAVDSATPADPIPMPPISPFVLFCRRLQCVPLLLLLLPSLLLAPARPALPD